LWISRKKNLTRKFKKREPPPVVPVEFWPRKGGTPIEGRDPCPFQVYVEEELARGMIKQLARIGILATPYRCSVCGMIHLKEKRQEPSNGNRPH
jgi:hypothetical protein